MQFKIDENLPVEAAHRMPVCGLWMNAAYVFERAVRPASRDH